MLWNVDLKVFGSALYDFAKRSYYPPLAAPPQSFCEAGAQPQIVDVRYSDLTADPMRAIADIYTAFGATVTSQASARMLEFLRQNPRNKHGKHVYTLEQFGLQAGVIRHECAA